jgi:molybdopterin synthase catalytic subunit
MHVILTPTAFNPWQTLADYEQQLQHPHKIGAVSSFVGTMRDNNEGDAVQTLFLEHYPQMTEHYLRKISQQALQQWQILDTLIVHRVGVMVPNDTIVLVAAWAAHRGAAFDACRYLIEELKHRAPFWKRETLATGDRWVQHNTPAN